MTYGQHRMVYRAGTSGFAALGIPDSEPHWDCWCGQWRFTAKAMSTRKAGNNLIEADRSWRKHFTEATTND